MKKNIKRMFFVTTLLILLVGLSAISAADASNDTIGTSQQDVVKEVNVEKVSDNTITDTSTKNIKKDVKTHIVTNDTISDVFSKEGVSPYNDLGFNSLLLGDNIDDGDILDFQGTIKGNYNLTINKAVNITSSTNNAKIDLDTHRGTLTGETPGNHFIIDIRGSYTNITNVNFHNTQIFIYNTSHINIDNITSITEDQPVGGGVGVTSIREGSEYINVKNSYFYVRNNSGSSVFTLSRAQYCNVDNCTFEGIECGNIFYLNYYNTWSECENIYNNITNCIIRGGPGGISLPLVLNGEYNILKNNTCSAFITTATYPQRYNSFIGNNVSQISSTYFVDSLIINNTVNRISTTNSTIKNNIIRGLVYVSGGNFSENIVYGQVRISGNNSLIFNNTINNGILTSNIKNSSIISNNISGQLIINGTNNIIQNNSVFVSDDYTILLNSYNNIVKDNYLRTIASGGDDTVYSKIPLNTIANNTPLTNSKNIEITDETYLDYFNEDGLIINEEITDLSTIDLNGTFYNKQFNIEDKSLIIQGLSNTTLIDCSIITNDDAHLDIRNITMINNNNTNGIIFNSNRNRLQNSTIIVNSSNMTPIILNGDQIILKNNNITVHSNSDSETIVIKLNSNYNNILNNFISTNTGNTSIIYLNGSIKESNNNIIQNNTIYSVDRNINVITLENSNDNKISKNNITVNSTGNVTGIYFKDGNSSSNNITDNIINIKSENAMAIKLSYNNSNNVIENTFITRNKINTNANNNSIIVKSDGPINSLTMSYNAFYAYGEKSIGAYLEGENMDLFNNTIISQSNTYDDDYYNLNSTVGIIFINTTNTRINLPSSGLNDINVTNGYGIKLINSYNMLIETVVTTSNYNYTIVLINSSNNIINESYIKANKTGGDDAILEINSQDNQYINVTPKIIYLTDENYETYFTDNLLNYKNDENKLRNTHIILDSDLYNKTMQFEYRIVIDNPYNHTLHNCKIIYSFSGETTPLLDINKYSTSFNNLNIINYDEEFVIKANSYPILNNSNIYHENHNMKTHTIEGSAAIYSSNIITIGPEIETEDNTPSTVAILGSAELNNTNITVKANTYDNKGFISGIYSTANIPDAGSSVGMNLDIVGKENIIGIRGLRIISNSQISMNANNIIGYIRGSREGIYSSNSISMNMTLNANNSATAIYGNYTGARNAISDSFFNITSNNTAVMINETLGNYTLSNTTFTINAKNSTILTSENSEIIVERDSIFHIENSEISTMTSKNDKLTIYSSNFNINSSTESIVTIINSTQTRIYNNTFIFNSPQNTPPIILNTNNSTINNNYLESKNYISDQCIQNNGENIIENNTPNTDGEYKIKINTNKDRVILNKENTIKINITNMFDENITGKITVTSNNQIIPIIDNTITWTASRETFNPPTTTFTNIINNQNLTTAQGLNANTIINNTTINLPDLNNQTNPSNKNSIQTYSGKTILINNSILNTPISNSADIYIYNSTLNGSYYGSLYSILYVDENTIIGENFKIMTQVGNSIYTANIFTNNKQLLEILEKNDIEPINKPTLTFTYTDPEGKYNTTTISKTFTIVSPTLTVDPVTATVGQTVNITARITADDETITDINKGKVTFKVNGKTLKDANGKVIYVKVVNGVATIENYIVPSDWAKEGTTIQAVYSGSSECDKLTSEKTEITIQKAVPTLTTEDITATTGGKITLKATITDNNKVINTGKIVFKINGKTVKDENGKVIYAKVVNNTVEFEYTLPESYKAGSYNITATFISADYDRLTDSKTLTITA